MAEISSLVLPFFGLILLGYVAARWRTYDPAAVSTALDRATGRSLV